jgi:competence protein ComEC
MNPSEHMGPLVVLFAAGTASGVLLPFPPEAVPGLACAGVALLAAGTAALLPRRKTGPAALLPPLFFLCGLLCALTERLGCAAETPAFLRDLAAGAVARFRRAIAETPFPHEGTAPLLQALLTGDRSGLTRETVAVFRRSGASHLLALSGLHAGILYLCLSKGLSLLGNSPRARRARAILVLAATGFYTIMTGASPSIVRAFLFILIRETALLAGRQAEPLRVYALALTVQLALHPSVIRSVGFQLSYAAMLGIFLLYPVLEKAYPAAATTGPVSKWTARHDPVRFVWNSAALSIACQAFTAPVAWLYFKTFPRYFLLTNLLAIPLTTMLVPGALAAVAVHAALPSTAADRLAADLADRLAEGLQRVLEIIAAM